MVQPIIMHINYCEQGQTIAEVCQKAVDWGFDGVEFRGRREAGEESNEQYLDAIAKSAASSGLKHVLFGTPVVDLMNPDKDYRSREIEEAVGFYRLAAQRFNLSICNATVGPLCNPSEDIGYEEYEKQGSFLAEEDHYRWAADGFRILGDAAQELGFRFAFEIHPNYIHDRISTTIKLLNLIGHPAVGANLDYENVLYISNEPTFEESVNLLGSRLYYVHLKNSISIGVSGRLATGLSGGEINHRIYLRLLKAVGYEGPICVEAPRPGDTEWYAPQDLAYLKTLLAEI